MYYLTFSKHYSINIEFKGKKLFYMILSCTQKPYLKQKKPAPSDHEQDFNQIDLNITFVFVFIFCAVLRKYLLKDACLTIPSSPKIS